MLVELGSPQPAAGNMAPSLGFPLGVVLVGKSSGKVPGGDLEVLVLMWLLLGFLEGERAFTMCVKMRLVVFTCLELPQTAACQCEPLNGHTERIPLLLHQVDLGSHAEVPRVLQRAPLDTGIVKGMSK